MRVKNKERGGREAMDVMQSMIFSQDAGSRSSLSLSLSPSCSLSLFLPLLDSLSLSLSHHTLSGAPLSPACPLSLCLSNCLSVSLSLSLSLSLPPPPHTQNLCLGLITFKSVLTISELVDECIHVFFNNQSIRLMTEKDESNRILEKCLTEQT